jgi:precorrin-2/cobalt-factor-2 C20-methyltransferase
MKKLYMVSLGPADYELVTIKALKALQKSDVICIPTKSKDNSFDKSITYNIVKSLIDEFGFEKKIVPVYTPMRFAEKDWLYQVDILLNELKAYDNVSFVTLGDSGVYSTVYYLLDYIKERNIEIYNDSEVIPGVTSFSQASAKVKKPLVLGDSKLTITPLVDNELKETTVYMRPKRGMDTSTITQNGDMYTFENLNLKEEKISDTKIDEVSKYMTLFIDFYKA